MARPGNRPRPLPKASSLSRQRPAEPPVPRGTPAVWGLPPEAAANPTPGFPRAARDADDASADASVLSRDVPAGFGGPRIAVAPPARGAGVSRSPEEDADSLDPFDGMSSMDDDSRQGDEYNGGGVSRDRPMRVPPRAARNQPMPATPVTSTIGFTAAVGATLPPRCVPDQYDGSSAAASAALAKGDIPLSLLAAAGGSAIASPVRGGFKDRGPAWSPARSPAAAPFDGPFDGPASGGASGGANGVLGEGGDGGGGGGGGHDGHDAGYGARGGGWLTVEGAGRRVEAVLAGAPPGLRTSGECAEVARLIAAVPGSSLAGFSSKRLAALAQRLVLVHHGRPAAAPSPSPSAADADADADADAGMHAGTAASDATDAAAAERAAAERAAAGLPVALVQPGDAALGFCLLLRAIPDNNQVGRLDENDNGSDHGGGSGGAGGAGGGDEAIAIFRPSPLLAPLARRVPAGMAAASAAAAADAAAADAAAADAAEARCAAGGLAWRHVVTAGRAVGTAFPHHAVIAGPMGAGSELAPAAAGRRMVNWWDAAANGTKASDSRGPGAGAGGGVHNGLAGCGSLGPMARLRGVGPFQTFGEDALEQPPSPPSPSSSPSSSLFAAAGGSYTGRASAAAGTVTGTVGGAAHAETAQHSFAAVLRPGLSGVVLAVLPPNDYLAPASAFAGGGGGGVYVGGGDDGARGGFGGGGSAGDERGELLGSQSGGLASASSGRGDGGPGLWLGRRSSAAAGPSARTVGSARLGGGTSGGAAASAEAFAFGWLRAPHAAYMREHRCLRLLESAGSRSGDACGFGALSDGARRWLASVAEPRLVAAGDVAVRAGRQVTDDTLLAQKLRL